MSNENPSASNPDFAIKDEGDIHILLIGIVDLIDLIASNYSNKARIYFTEHLVLSMRELSFYAKKYFREKIADDMQRDMATIKDIRDAICHRSSDNNWLSSNIKIQGCTLYRGNDIEIQYGESHIYLIGGIIKLYRDFRGMFNNPSSPYHVRRNPYGLEQKELQLAEGIRKVGEAIKSELERIMNPNPN